jgi:hypothetical protein
MFEFHPKRGADCSSRIACRILPPGNPYFTQVVPLYGLIFHIDQTMFYKYLAMCATLLRVKLTGKNIL